MIYKYKGNTEDVESNQFDNAFSLLDKIRDGKISLTAAKNDQEDFGRNLRKIEKTNTKKKKIKRAKEHFVQYWNALQSKKRDHSIFWWLFFNGIWSKKKVIRRET